MNYIERKTKVLSYLASELNAAQHRIDDNYGYLNYVGSKYLEALDRGASKDELEALEKQRDNAYAVVKAAECDRDMLCEAFTLVSAIGIELMPVEEDE